MKITRKRCRAPWEKHKKSLKKRNELDVKRRFSPLIQSKDSIIIRTDKLNKKAMVAKMSKEIEKKLIQLGLGELDISVLHRYISLKK